MNNRPYNGLEKTNERGNVLWIIMIAIGLLAALTITLTRSGSSVDQSGDIEQQRIRASQVLRYAKGIETAVQKMKLNGISENDISFANPITSTDYTNANCTSVNCLVFDAAGGGQSYLRPPGGTNDGSDWIFTGANNVGTTAKPVGTTAAVTGNDLVMMLANASSGMCDQINRDLGVGTAGTLPTDGSGIATTAFTGAFASGTPLVIDGDPSPYELDGQPAGCFSDTSVDPAVTYFYYVILPR